MAAGISNLPPSLKCIQPYLKVAKEYEKRDPIVAYYCRLHAVQKGIKTDSKSTEGKTFLIQLMDQLEKTKKDLNHEDAISSEVVGQAYLDEQGRQLFLWADTEDRAARFNKNVIKSFYTASLMYDALAQFGELTDEASQRQKYSKWKATYINKCLKEGTTPVPGPPGGVESDEFASELGEGSNVPPPYQPPGGGSGYPPGQNTGQPQPYTQPGPSQPPSGGSVYPPGPNTGQPHPYTQPGPSQPPSGGSVYPPGPNTGQPYSYTQPGPSQPPSGGGGYPPGQNTGQPYSYTQPGPPQPPSGGSGYPPGPNTSQPPAQPPSHQQPTVPEPKPSSSESGLTPQDYDKAQKLCRYAQSALQYEDVKTAIDNLQQALAILQPK